MMAADGRTWYNAAVRRLGLTTAGLLLLNVLLVVPRCDRARARAGSGLRVGLVFDVGGRGDKSFNDSAWRGVDRAVRELGVAAEYIEPGEGADRESGIRLLAAEGFDLII